MNRFAKERFYALIVISLVFHVLGIPVLGYVVIYYAVFFPPQYIQEKREWERELNIKIHR